MPISKKIFVSIPFGLDPKKQKERTEINNRYVGKLIFQAHVPVSPITIGTTALATMPEGVAKSIPYAYWIRLSVEYMVGVQEIHVIKCDGWESSPGVQIEISIAKIANIPVKYIDPISFEEVGTC